MASGMDKMSNASEDNSSTIICDTQKVHDGASTGTGTMSGETGKPYLYIMSPAELDHMCKAIIAGETKEKKHGTGCQQDKPEEEQEQEQADKRPMLPQPADSTGLTPALKKLKMSPEHGDLVKNIKKLQLSDQENNKPDAKDPEMAKEKIKGSEAPKPKRDSPKKKSKAKTSDKEDGIESPSKEKSKEVKIPKAEKSKDVRGSPKEEKSKEAKSSPKTEKIKDAEKEVKADEKKVTTGDLPKKEEGKPESNGKAEKEVKKNGSSEKKKKVSK